MIISYPPTSQKLTPLGSHLICGAGAQSGAATTFPSAQSLAELHRREGCGMRDISGLV